MLGVPLDIVYGPNFKVHMVGTEDVWSRSLSSLSSCMGLACRCVKIGLAHLGSEDFASYRGAKVPCNMVRHSRLK